MSRQNTIYVRTLTVHAGTQTVSVKSSHGLLSFYHFSAPAISLTDVIVSSGGGLSLIEVGVSECVCMCVCVTICPEPWLVLFGLSDKLSSALSLSLSLFMLQQQECGTVKVTDA